MPSFIGRVQGSILEDVYGTHIIDLAAGIAVTRVGATNTWGQAQVALEMSKFTHTCFMVIEYDSFTKVAAWLINEILAMAPEFSEGGMVTTPLAAILD
ncbi:aminotransferase class III-fold pyridoxal phosphate-dependent enzyme [Paeniglutamicibacter antarcticus]|uniref:Aminotransferase class III-fold pyridoxal phosphate-dependent enzyme n=1 Tax=Arthrobacter terrae TaxID=2935737 RepID=A0A931CNB1_9MICC|nr:aminotransferase class III-fold pyridoxal phosphate-dependent enzyme [Arthrobacter terrae]MBG0741378.1 aminotransferase class III-fold pyridoxal phosphate-dependent enzyme [Arthrobacter terrae]